MGPAWLSLVVRRCRTMNMKRLTSSLKLKALCALGLLAASLGTIGVRNDLFEFCTTKAYGFPFPWYYDWCLCERNSPPISPVSCAFNIVFVMVGSFPLAAVLQRFRRITPAP